MVSNALSVRGTIPRPPAVCFGGPKPPYPPLVLDLWAVPKSLTWYDSAAIHILGHHPAREVGEEYSVEWEVEAGVLDPPPPTYNGEEGVGSWLPPQYAGTFTIKAFATWLDGTKAFSFVEITVTEP